MRKLTGSAWVWIIAIIGAVALTAYVVMDMIHKKEIHETARRTQYIKQLQSEIQVNKMLCRMVLQETGDKDETFAVNVKALKEFMILSQDIFTIGPQASERLKELKQRMDVKGMLTVDGFQTYINPKEAADVMDIYVNLEWLLNKAAADKYDLNF
jgi:type VI protein secretion system component VasK